MYISVLSLLRLSVYDPRIISKKDSVINDIITLNVFDFDNSVGATSWKILFVMVSGLFGREDTNRYNQGLSLVFLPTL